MDLDLAMRRWASILLQFMLLLPVVLIPAAIVLAAVWCWAKWLSPAVQVDTLLATGVILGILQCSLGPARRYSAHWFVQYGARLAFYIQVPVVAYALSKIWSVSHIEGDLFTIAAWSQMTSLAFSRRTKGMALYSLSDTLQHGMLHAKRIIYLFYWLLIAVIACWHSHLPLEHFLALITILMANNLLSMVWLTGYQRPVSQIISSYRSEKLAEYMMEVAASETGFFDPEATILDNCRYPFEMTDDGDQVSVKDILYVLDSSEEPMRTYFRQVCLSYSLYNMIKRRHYRISCAEQGDENVLEFVSKGFPTFEDGRPGMEVFQVVELQLAFLYDNFFVEHSYLDFRLPQAIGILQIMIQGTIILSVGVAHLEDLIQSTQTIARVISGLVLLLIVGVQDQLHMVSYLASYWCKVWQMCFLYSGQEVVFSKIIFWIALACIGRRPKYFIPNIWQYQIGQYSLIKDCDHISVKRIVLAWIMRFFLAECYDFISHHPEQMDPVSLDDIVKEEVYSAFVHFVNSGESLSNGVSSVKRNQVSELLSWKCNQPTHTDTILEWHVATSYCEKRDMDYQNTNSYKVATALSKYCAYLVAFLPELLTEHIVTTRKVFQRVLGEAEQELRYANSDTKKIELMAKPPKQEAYASLNTFEKGIKLGHELENLDGELRWKVMAEFWSETMLYIAPSDKVATHIDQLAKGGEFITHIWALLSNAGILERTDRGSASAESSVDSAGSSVDSTNEEHPNAQESANVTSS
jgi:hypothetical protein